MSLGVGQMVFCGMPLAGRSLLSPDLCWDGMLVPLTASAAMKSDILCTVASYLLPILLLLGNMLLAKWAYALDTTTS